MAGARAGLHEYLRRGLELAYVGRIVDPDRLLRFLGYGFVGLSGIPVDMLVTNAAASAGAHYVAATLIGYTLAMTWNFVWQRRYVFSSTGNPIREYIRYLGVDLASAVVRTGVVVGLMVGVRPTVAAFATRTGRLLPLLSKHTVEPVTVASLAGILVAFIVGFLLTDTFVFSGGERLA